VFIYLVILVLIYTTVMYHQHEKKKLSKGKQSRYSQAKFNLIASIPLMHMEFMMSDYNNIVYGDMHLKCRWHILGKGRANGKIIWQLSE
jgi:hypothetical protein